MHSIPESALKGRIDKFFKSYKQQFLSELDKDQAIAIVTAELQKKMDDYVVKYLTDVDSVSLVHTLALLQSYKKTPDGKAKPSGATTIGPKPKTKAKKKVNKNAKKGK